jgi:hypothetical protein
VPQAREVLASATEIPAERIAFSVLLQRPYGAVNTGRDRIKREAGTLSRGEHFVRKEHPINSPVDLERNVS